MAAVSVTNPCGQNIIGTVKRSAHHLNDTGTLFTNPWSSFRASGGRQWLQALKSFTRPAIPPQVNELMGFRTPDWGAGAHTGKIKATWLGHACFLVELPSPSGAARGPRVLFDPVFSHRCSPFSWIGPARFTEPPCALKQLPEIDIIVISHNHYDHMDKNTLNELVFPAQTPSTPRVHVFAPLNNDDLFKSLSIPQTNFHCLDWWQNRVINVSLPASTDNQTTESDTERIPTTFKLTCTPCQHFTGRGILDRFTTLWSSWALESNVPEPDTNNTVEQSSPSNSGVKVWFGGDTGYRTVQEGENEDEVPVCPAFREIGERFGGFDLALIPIGAYLPRAALSSVHCAPQDSVRVFTDIKARRAIGMHWGTWRLSYEQIMAPPERLKEACGEAGIPDGTFSVCGLGETVIV